MDYKQLLEKYWAGETTLAEEKQLKAHFEQEEVATDLRRYKSLFAYMKTEQKRTFNQPILPINHKEKPPQKQLFRLNYLMRIAASVLFLIAFGLVYQTAVKPSKAERIAAYWAAKEINDPKVAYKKTKAALLLVSKKLNQGTEAALQQVEKVQQVGIIIKSSD